MKIAILLSLVNVGVKAFAPQVPFVRNGSSIQSSKTKCHSSISTSGMWNAGLSYGKGQFRFYKNFEEWIAPFPEEDRKEFPEIFTFPEGVFEVSLKSPLGIVFEEIEIGKGVYVTDLVEGGNAERYNRQAGDNAIKPGDILVGISAVKVIGAKWERRVIPALNFDFDTVVGAIMSNEEKWGCSDTVLHIKRPDADDEVVSKFYEFFEPPSDSVWRL